MKKQIKISFIATSLLLFGYITQVHAQNWLTAGNTLTGGTSSTPNEWVGSNNLYDLIMKTNNIQRIRLISGGHVLIGSGTAATYPLTLNDYTNAGTLSSGGNFAVSLHSITGGAAIGGQDTGNNNAVFGATGSTSDILFATYNGSSFDERVIIKSAGNVGIGTSSPDIWGAGTNYRTLTILGPNTSAGSCGMLELASQSTDADANKAGGINFIASANASGKRNIASIYSFTQGATATNRGGYLAFSTKPDNYTSDVERMRITSTGNLGIGTSSPATKLNVSTAASNDGIRVTQTGTTAAALSLNQTTTGGHNWALFSKGSGNGAAGAFSIYDWTSGGDRLYITTAGNIGIGTTNPGYTLEVNGTTANTAGGLWTVASDIRVKTDTSSFTDGLSIIKQIHPVNFRYNGKTGIRDTINFHIGVIAQQIQSIAPYTVGTYMAKLDTSDVQETQFLDFNGSPLIYLFVNAFKELDSINVQNDSVISILKQKLINSDSINTVLNNVQQQSIDSLRTITTTQGTIIMSLQDQLTQLASLIDDCCNNHGNGHGNNLNQSGTNNYKSMSPTTLTDVELSNKNIVVLNQNVPNPFAEQTTISYYLPDNVQRAQILFFEQSGKIIKTVDLKEKGKGTLNVFANDLSNGIYTYSLIIDGQTIETKKMVKQ